MTLQQRRRYFRIDDLVGIDYQLLDVEDGEIEDAHSTDSLPAMLAGLDNEISAQRGILSNKYPEMGKLFDLLNRKVNNILTMLVNEGVMHLYEGMKDKQVNLSACGVAFHNDDALPIGQLVRIKIHLYEPNLVVCTLARVVGCQASSAVPLDGPYYIRVDYYKTAPDQQEVLIQYIVRRQSVLLKERREIDRPQ